MTFKPDYSLETALEENFTFSDKQEKFLVQITDRYKKLARKVNEKERAYYPLEVEILNDQQFFVTGNAQKYRSVFRKVFSFGTIAAGATLNITHNITGAVLFTRIYGTCVTIAPVVYKPIPYVSIAAANRGIQVSTTATTITIINGVAPELDIANGFIVLEYVKQ